jgi:hypothetical protein
MSKISENNYGNIVQEKSGYILCIPYKNLSYYGDIVKDIIMLLHIWNMIFGGNNAALIQMRYEFPGLIFGIIITSIVGSEILNALSMIASCATTSEKNNVLYVLFVPLVPAVIHYQEAKLTFLRLQAYEKISVLKDESSRHKLLTEEDHLIQYLKGIQNLQLQRTRLTANENIVEHFIQLVILILMLLL